MNTGNRAVTTSCCSLLLIFIVISGVFAQDQEGTNETSLSVDDPARLIANTDVSYSETSRTFRKAKFEGLKQRYSTIEGIVMVGIVNNNGEVLLKGPGNWSPPGGAVQPGEDWAAAARRVIRQQTGTQIYIERPVVVEEMCFQQKGDRDKQFSAYILHFRARLADEVAGTSTIESLDSFSWFNNIPEDAHPNHTSHIKFYLE